MLKPKAPTPAATYADLEALPANMVGEIIFGALYAHPRPTPQHSKAAGELQYELTGPFGRGRGGPGGWIFLVEPELRLGSHVLVPDVGGWRTERTPSAKTAFIESAPDWIAEILSPSTQAIDRTHKLAIYAQFGVPHCWYIDPLARTLEVLALENGKWVIHSTFKDDATVCAPPFEVHSFPLDVLWYPEEPAAPPA